MAASSSDYLTKVGSPGTASSLSAPGHSIAGTSITVGSTSNWPTTTGAIFAIDTVTLVNGVEVRDVGSYTEWEGVVASSTSVTGCVLRYGTDQNYSAGTTTRVYIPVASSRENRLVDGLLVAHDQDGTLKAGAVDVAAVLASNVVTTAKILDNNVTASKLATSAITLGYTQITGTFSTDSSTAVQVTGLTTTVTIPAGGRRVKITAFIPEITNTVGVTTAQITIWDGVVGSGTQLNAGDAATFPVANYFAPGMAIAVVTPSAGSKTYNVGIKSTASSNIAVSCSATQVAFILVEAI